MEERIKRPWIALLLFVLFSGLTFMISYKLLSLFGYNMPNVPIWLHLVLGNITSLSFAYLAGVIERISNIEEIFD